jgi:hypothetical protein
LSNSSRSSRPPRDAAWRNARREQAAATRQWTWAKIRFDRERSFVKFLTKIPAELSGAAHKLLKALAQLEGNRWGAIIASGEQIAEAAGVHPSTWWEQLPILQARGIVTCVYRGGGRIPGGDGRANVYQFGKVDIPEPRPESPPPPASSTWKDVMKSWRETQERITKGIQTASRSGP